MAAVIFDTLQFAQNLMEAGFTDKQANAITKSQKAVLEESMSNELATKSDIQRLESKIEKNEFLLKTFGAGIFAALLGVWLKLLF